MNPLAKAINVLLSEINKSLPGIPVEISIEDDSDETGSNVEIFQQALTDPEIQRILASKNNTIRFRIISPINQVRDYMLANIKRIRGRLCTFQTYERDSDVYFKAAKTPEIITALQRYNNRIEIQVLDKKGSPKPKILIATYEDIINGKLDELY